MYPYCLKLNLESIAYQQFYCPGKEASMGIIVVSLPYSAYLCGALIAFYKKPHRFLKPVRLGIISLVV